MDSPMDERDKLNNKRQADDVLLKEERSRNKLPKKVQPFPENLIAPPFDTDGFIANSEGINMVLTDSMGNKIRAEHLLKESRKLQLYKFLKIPNVSLHSPSWVIEIVITFCEQYAEYCAIKDEILRKEKLDEYCSGFRESFQDVTNELLLAASDLEIRRLMLVMTDHDHDHDDAIRSLQMIESDHLEEVRELGHGAYGTVYYGLWKGAEVAIKKLKSERHNAREEKEFIDEAVRLSTLRHPNVMCFYGLVKKNGKDGYLAIVTELMSHGSLKDVLRSGEGRRLDYRGKVKIAIDVAKGMEYLHAKKVVHFDLKSANLLVSLTDARNPVCKVADLGLSKIRRRNSRVSCEQRGTLPWMAPEVLASGRKFVSEKVDVFSYGVVLWEVLTGGVTPYNEITSSKVEDGVIDNTLRPPIPAKCPPSWELLMTKCWSADPGDRPSFSKISLDLKGMLDSES